MKNTGKKLTQAQIEAVLANLNRPAMYISGGQLMGGDETPSQQVHKFAIENGLPEIPGFYGADLKTGIIYEVD